MPQFTVRGVSAMTMSQVTKCLTPDLAKIMACPEDYFTYDCISSQSFYGGHSVPTAPFIEILWFDRGREVQDKVAQAVNQAFTAAGVKELELCFKPVQKCDYYADGVSYAGD